MSLPISPFMALMLAQEDDETPMRGRDVMAHVRGDIATFAQDTPAPSTLYAAIDMPEDMAVAMYEDPELPARLADEIGVTAKRTWKELLDEGGPTYWPELQDETVALKRRRGDPFPDEPMRGTGRMENEMEAIRPEKLIEKYAEGILITVTFPPYGGDMQPTERYGDLQYGSPATMEEEARFSETKNNTERGVVPPRPLGMDQRVRQNVAGVLEHFGIALEPDAQAQYAYSAEVQTAMAINENEEGYGVIPFIPEITQTRPQ